MNKEELLKLLEEKGIDFDTRALIVDDVLDIINKQCEETAFYQQYKREHEIRARLENIEIPKLEGELDWERRNKICIVKQLEDPNAYVSLEEYKKVEQERFENRNDYRYFKNLSLSLQREVDELKEVLKAKIDDMKSTDFIKMCLKSGFAVEAHTTVPVLEHQINDTIYVLDFDGQVKPGEVVDIQITDFSQGNPSVEYEIFMGSWDDSDWYPSYKCFKTLEEAEKYKEAKDE